MASHYADKAILLALDDAEAHFVRARVHTEAGEMDQALARYDQAIALNPSASNILAASASPLLFVGRIDEAIDRIEQRVRGLTMTCLKLLKAAGLDSQTPDTWEERAHIINVVVPDAVQLMQRLRENHRVVTNVKDGALRLSVSFYNDEDDLERAVRAIKQEIGTRSGARAAAR